MLEIKNVTKKLSNKIILKDLNLTIKEGEIFGLVGINGAGKSTLLRIINGIYKPEEGSVIIDNEDVYDNPKIKKDMFFVSDDPYYPLNATSKTIINFYKSFYDIDETKFYHYINLFKLDINGTINNFSKGMKRQLFVAIALAIAPKYLFLDEAFDGLDPFARLILKKAIINLVEEKNISVIISSHSLRELEDFCDRYGLLDENHIVNSGTIDESKEKVHKYQLVFTNDIDENAFKSLHILQFNKIGHIVKIIVEGDKNYIEQEINKLNPLLVDNIEINFEELFIIEIENRGYIHE